MKQLDRKSVWIFFFRHFSTWVFFLLWLSVLFIGVIIEGSSPVVVVEARHLYWLAIYVLAIIFFSAVVGYVLARLSYHFYRYELREDCFRKESGIIWKRYVSLPYERIQNVDIYRGILTRILGLSNLSIQTAGFSGPSGGVGASTEGYLPGLSKEEAELLRDELVKRARGAKNQGL